MPTGAHESLQKLYERQKLLLDEAAKLETECNEFAPDSDRHYILVLEIAALCEESTRLDAKIADILERDLDR
jgi:hypothetical protein